MIDYIKLDKPKSFTEFDKRVKTSIDKIKEENYENYFIYSYKNKQNNKKYTKRRILKVYKD